MKRAADLGDIEAISELGKYYYYKDEDSKAIYYFKQILKKANKNTIYYDEASYYLGTCYFYGYGTEKDYEAAVKEAFKYDSKVICEEFIEGKELTIPVMDGKAFPPIWIRPKKGFYNYENKYTAGMTEYLLDTGLSAARIRNLKKLAVKVYNTLGCRSMARIDFIATDRKFYVIEVNTVPGMTATSLVPKSASKLGISFEEIVKKIAESASLDNKK